MNSLEVLLLLLIIINGFYYDIYTAMLQSLIAF